MNKKRNPPADIGEIIPGGGWIEAERLSVGQELMTADGTTARIVSIAIEDTPLNA